MNFRIGLLLVTIFFINNALFAKNFLLENELFGAVSKNERSSVKCIDFSGKWEDQENNELSVIEQTGCELLTIKDINSETGRINNIQKIGLDQTEVINKSKNDGTFQVYNTTLYKFNEEKDQILFMANSSAQIMGYFSVASAIGNMWLSDDGQEMFAEYQMDVKVLETGEVKKVSMKKRYGKIGK